MGGFMFDCCLVSWGPPAGPSASRLYVFRKMNARTGSRYRHREINLSQLTMPLSRSRLAFS